ncbi:carbohydrate kinase family protein [Paenarthrobacter ureafaciens]|uniref:carbohydrate kinase family protein n=1 Tax=Paenarthrobacter ureafaciens TaxID=37931 RepID=UPI00140C967F|nr:carbohydrate kinase [Paenarthrobacter ureafaciens]MCX8455911.1 carbohydrate kinase [Paenarthrobacter ureafaciens]MCY0974876.1 carbohydrate kinase [Paenarthrobacter ureafaciens]
MTATPSPAPEPLDVVVVGEALIDIVQSPDGQIEYPGGSPANVAYGLGRLDIKAGLLTAIGRDERGDAITEHLQSAGVVLLPGSKSLGKTATATAQIGDDGSAEYTFDIDWSLPPVVLPYAPRILHTGSIATFLQPGASVVRGMLEQAQGGCMVTYDPNIRRDLLGSHHEALSLFEELVPLTDVVKMSEDDARWLYPGKDLAETARHLLSLGTVLAVVTQGANGSLMATRETQLNVPAIPSTVADTIGAGDSYMSALILGLLLRGSDGLAPTVLERIGTTASMAASITVGRSGANPPTHRELLAGMAR